MGSIYLTGDTHAAVERLIFIDDSEMTKEDIVIVLGDFGVVWQEQSLMTDFVLEQLSKKNFTTAFLDGNHENFTELKHLETIEDWCDGKVGMLPYGIIHLLRGEIYNINGRRVGVCGGANSIDKFRRTEGLSWWADEEITDQDIDHFITNLKGNLNLDLVLTHDCPCSLVPVVKLYSGVNDSDAPSNSQRELEKIYDKVKFKKWYFGHWHINQIINEQFECLYKEIKEV